MRLLERDDTGEVRLTENLPNNKIPPYAILSHTWGNGEILFRDLMDGIYKNKAGYTKIRFCGDQAWCDGLSFFWVDTCCIDKSNSVELQEAINSMFRWYRNATKCYTYLVDVSVSLSDAGDKSIWEPAFRASRWFTRGWTLQELIAPKSVEFFSREGARLGDRITLERVIHDVTGIPLKVLQGGPLSDFSVNDRMAWIEKRTTTREEDMAYSLFGIFDVQLPLIYSEGKQKAFRRLREEINKESKDYGPYRTSFSLQGVPVSNHFVARPSVTAELEECLLPRCRSREIQRRIFVLYGLGGIGKTQLAADFARRHQAVFSSVFWLDGRSEDRLRQSLASCAARIPEGQVSERSRNAVLHSEEDLKTVAADVLDWLAQPDNSDWLLIFDNVDQDVDHGSETGAYDVRRYLPGDHGSVLITTRLSRLAQLGESTRLRGVDEQLANAIFQQWRGAEGALDEAGRELLGLLDGLPLALAQAASYIRETGLDNASYVRLYKQQWDDLMGSDGESGSPLVDYEQGSVATTWTVSFKAVEAQNKNAANLLRLWAFVDGRDLWHGLLQAAAEGGEQWPGWLCDVAGNEVRYLDAVRLLLRYSMIESQESVQGSHMMHPVVHRWASHVQDGAEKREVLQLAVMVVGLSVPRSTTKDYWIIQRRLLPHAERCSWWITEMYNARRIFDDTRAIDAMHTLGNLYADQGRLTEAESMYQWALEGREKALGQDHTSTLDTVNNLGILYRDQGRLTEAESMYQRALEGKEKALGRDHTSTLDTVNNLGLLYRDQGRLTEAESMYQRALEGYEKALGRDHTSTLDTVNNLGSLYTDQGRLTEAESMYQRALEGKEKAFGRDHTSTLNTVNNLGILYRDQGRLTEAESMYQRALEGYEKALGQDHTSTLSTVNNLGNLYMNQGRLTEAESMYQRALEGKEKALGRDHTSTLDTVNNLGVLYRDQGRLTEAESMYQRALEGSKKALGRDHTSTLHTVNNLGILYTDQGRLTEAESMYQWALEGYEKALGQDHTSTLDTVNNLGSLYRDQGRLTEAESMYQRALEGKEKALGRDHSSTLNAIGNLGLLYADQGRLTEAESMYQRALEGKEKALGRDHTSTLNTVNNLGSLYRDQGLLTEAESMYQRALSGFRVALGPSHWKTQRVMQNLDLLPHAKGPSATTGPPPGHHRRKLR